MPWFIVVYLLLLAALGVYSFYDDHKEKRSAAYLAVDALATVIWIYFVLVYFSPSLAKPSRPVLLLLFIFALAWTAADAWREIRSAIAQRPASHDPELSPRANLWIDRTVETGAVALGLLVLMPALVFAMLVIRTAW